MHAPGFWNIILILAIVVLLFGGKKLPQLGGAFGQALKNFKKAVKDVEKSAASDSQTPPQSQSQAPIMEPQKTLPPAQPETKVESSTESAAKPQA